MSRGELLERAAAADLERMPGSDVDDSLPRRSGTLAARTESRRRRGRDVDGYSVGDESRRRRGRDAHASGTRAPGWREAIGMPEDNGVECKPKMQ